jgi:magnesium transporter
MLTVYVRPADAGSLVPEAGARPDDPRAIWIDLLQPTNGEESSVEKALNIDVPIPQERAGEVDSARFYEENGGLFLTATLLGRREDGPFVSDAVTFILINGKLVTVRQIRPRAFEVGSGRASAHIGAAKSGGAVFLALLGSLVERLADLLAESRKSARDLSVEIFSEGARTPNLRDTLRTLGRLGTTVALVLESLVSLQRLALFTEQVCDRYGLPKSELSAFRRDVQELERGAASLDTHLNLLQEATLGLVGATQSETLKALAVATIAFVPPTLIASIFGMNFDAMTWFKQDWGPWAGLALMIAAPAALFVLARWRKWF